MPRLLGITIPENKVISRSLMYIYGIGLNSSLTILRSAKVDPQKRAKDLTGEELNKIQKLIEANYKVEGDLRKEVSQNIKHMKEIGSWRGFRHTRHLPIHGRSKTNSRSTRTYRGRKTMGSGRKPAGEKT